MRNMRNEVLLLVGIVAVTAFVIGVVIGAWYATMVKVYEKLGTEIIIEGDLAGVRSITIYKNGTVQMATGRDHIVVNKNDTVMYDYFVVHCTYKCYNVRDYIPCCAGKNKTYCEYYTVVRTVCVPCTVLRTQRGTVTVTYVRSSYP